MTGLLERLRELFGEDAAIGAYGFRFEEGRLERDFATCIGPLEQEAPAYFRDLFAACRALDTDLLPYDPVRPAGPVRNRAVLQTTPYIRRRARTTGSVRELVSRHGWFARYEQLRTLVCNGPVLVSWVGALRERPFSDAEHRLLERLAPAIRDRLVLEQSLPSTGLAVAALATALENVGSAAFVLREQALVHVNAAARALLERARARTAEDLREIACRRRRRGYLVSSFAAPGVPEYLVAIRAEPGEPTRDRLTLATARYGLTARQREVLALVAEGKSNKTIALALACSDTTVEFHVTALLRKLDCDNRAALVARFWTDRC